MHHARRALVRLCRLLAGFGALACSAAEPGAGTAEAPLLAPRSHGVSVADDEIIDAAPRSDGRYVAVLSGPPYLRTFVADSIERRGPRGRGPGDFLAPWTIVRRAFDGTAWGVWDLGRRRLIPLDQPDGGIEVEPQLPPINIRADLRAITHTKPFLAFATSSGFVVSHYPETLGSTRGLRNMVLLALDSVGAVTDTIWRLAPPAPDDVDARAHVAAHVPLWWMCSDTSLVVLDPTDRALQWLRPADDSVGAWTVAARVPVPAPPLPLVDSDARAIIFAAIANDAADGGGKVDTVAVRARVDQFMAERDALIARNVPPGRALYCDANGTVWLRAFSPSPHAGRWDIIAPDGAASTARTDDELLAFGITGNALLVATREADGALTLGRITAPRN